MQSQQLSAADDTALTVETADGVLFAIDIGVALYFTSSQHQARRWKKPQGWDSYMASLITISSAESR